MLWQALVHGIQKLLKNEICNGWKGRATGACAGRSIPKGLRPPAQGCPLFLKVLWQALAHQIQKPTDKKERATLAPACRSIPKGLRPSAQGWPLFLKVLWQTLAHRIRTPTDQKERATLGAHSDVPPTLKGLRHSDCIHRLPTACSNTFFHEYTHSRNQKPSRRRRRQTNPQRH